MENGVVAFWDEMTVKQCPLCGSQDLKTFLSHRNWSFCHLTHGRARVKTYKASYTQRFLHMEILTHRASHRDLHISELNTQSSICRASQQSSICRASQQSFTYRVSHWDLPTSELKIQRYRALQSFTSKFTRIRASHTELHIEIYTHQSFTYRASQQSFTYRVSQSFTHGALHTEFHRASHTELYIQSFTELHTRSYTYRVSQSFTHGALHTEFHRASHTELYIQSFTELHTRSFTYRVSHTELYIQCSKHLDPLPKRHTHAFPKKWGAALSMQTFVKAAGKHKRFRPRHAKKLWASFYVKPLNCLRIVDLCNFSPNNSFAPFLSKLKQLSRSCFIGFLN